MELNHRSSAIPLIYKEKTEASRKAEESWSVDCSQIFQEIEPPLPIVDHPCALPASPTGLKTRLCEALESLEHELRNVKDRERRAKKTVCDDLEDLQGKNLIN